MEMDEETGEKHLQLKRGKQTRFKMNSRISIVEKRIEKILQNSNSIDQIMKSLSDKRTMKKTAKNLHSDVDVFTVRVKNFRFYVKSSVQKRN